MKKIATILSLFLVLYFWSVSPILAQSKVIERAITNGVEAKTIVMLLLLPLLATLVSVMHYILGVSGYGIFVPTMIAVALSATGIAGGLILFGAILMISILSNLILKRLKLHFWPVRALGLVFISVGVFGLMVISTGLKMVDISNISIFPVLFMILLAEEFTRTQLVKSKKEAIKLTLGTLGLAILGAVLMGWQGVAEVVLRYPEAIIVVTVVINLMVGNYTGIRLTEIKRFRKAIRKK
ncbi:hypothetical protein COS78_00765 [Candidatus Shapirobacteria bacterium CG06_land_8_20_14_3_00_40_12]|uniref:7 transmembrane helices usually fused to an inactive transglutaminase domain-containing protein n=2 Tax=Candidatus Shapironibacteriota TaxID=1752721 RepID=A0A2M7TR93_9BACT|nr:MAG: hypothetical protein COS78_00765 [Candidatus Shapirobacteria bacterium CG06_land_8_20_14_3_00_40_12]PIZ57734.1 MAG: hypothetical protein COY20_04715 [Candidatus Shapirobacteria bacterium CG_4_10_14_0_2_um_filter_40_12]